LRTDDEGRPVSPDTYIDDKIYSEEEMVSLFRKVNPGRKTRAEMTDFFPPLTGQNADGYFIMFDRANPLGGEPLPVGRVGWKYLPEHKLYLTTGIKVIDMYRGMGLSRSLWQKRDSAIIKNTPAIGMASNFSENWIKLIQSEGWKIDPPVESLPESIQDEVRETIEGEKPRRLISKNIDMAMKKAWDILKMPKPYSGPDIRNEAQYEAASLEDRRGWHRQQEGAYNARLKVLQRNHSVDLTDTEHPIYQEMKQYQDLRAFHSRQRQRLGKCLRLGKTECNDYYSQELEGDNRQKQKFRTTPMGKRDPYVELSLEAYNDLTNEQKLKYHGGMTKRGIEEEFHKRMYARIYQKSNLPTFPSSKHGGEPVIFNVEYTKEEYENMNEKDKQKYHRNMASRATNLGDIALGKFHSKMYARIYQKSKLPVYYSPEEVAGTVPGERGHKYTSEEYQNMDKDSKRKYHQTMEHRARKEGDIETSKFHKKMTNRLRYNSPLPDYFSPEHEQEEE
jgi:hypothetical protein